ANPTRGSNELDGIWFPSSHVGNLRRLLLFGLSVVVRGQMADSLLRPTRGKRCFFIASFSVTPGSPAPPPPPRPSTDNPAPGSGTSAAGGRSPAGAGSSPGNRARAPRPRPR